MSLIYIPIIIDNSLCSYILIILRNTILNSLADKQLTVRFTTPPPKKAYITQILIITLSFYLQIILNKGLIFKNDKLICTNNRLYFVEIHSAVDQN